MFRVSTTPIIRTEHKTLTTASGTGHVFCAATSLQRGPRNSVGIATD